MLRTILHLGVSLMLGAFPLSAIAQSAPGQQQITAGMELLEAGKAAYSAGRFEQALSNFEQAYQRLQRAPILSRIGDTADKLGLHERAVGAWREYLQEIPQAHDRPFVESRIQANLEALEHPAASAALSPAAAARAGDATPNPPPEAAPTDGTQSQDLTHAWWLWAGAGALAVASIVVVAVLVGGSSTRDQDPIKGNVGGVVQTLGTR